MYIVNNLQKLREDHRAQNMLNLFIATLAMISLTAINMSYVTNYSTKARITEALFHVSSAQEKVMSAYRETGVWPNARLIHEKDDWSRNISEVYFDGAGTIDLIFGDNYSELAGKKLSFVASRSSNQHIDKIIWNCGYTLPLNGFMPLSKNNTTIELKYLPESCRP